MIHTFTGIAALKWLKMLRLKLVGANTVEGTITAGADNHFSPPRPIHLQLWVEEDECRGHFHRLGTKPHVWAVGSRPGRHWCRKLTPAVHSVPWPVVLVLVLCVWERLAGCSWGREQAQPQTISVQAEDVEWVISSCRWSNRWWVRPTTGSDQRVWAAIGGRILTLGASGRCRLSS